MAQTCFVVMGFGKKTDFQTGRVLDLDKTYHNIIKPAAEEAGLECIRADEIKHSGIIDVPMYEYLLKADVVVADLSTSNCNACYELGVRHALKPYTTIIIAEAQFKYPFDFSHIAIRPYHHLGEGIDFDEVMSFRAKLKDAIQVIASKPTDDSPVYEFLRLVPPQIAALQAAVGASSPAPAAANDQTVSVLMEQVEAALKQKEFLEAKSLLKAVQRMLPTDSYVTQRLALATYKSEFPDPQAALLEARGTLAKLDPTGSNDTETLGLWGAVHKRLWELTQDVSNLDQSIFAYSKGFYLRNDYYNGINLAFLLNLRAALPDRSKADSITDFVMAQRTRTDVMKVCRALLDGETVSGKPAPDHYWIAATLGEALFGTGQVDQAKTVLTAAYAGAAASWMAESTQQQIARLEQYLKAFPYRDVL